MAIYWFFKKRFIKAFFNAIISSGAVARVFSKMGEPISKIPKIIESQ
jgi:hypothetical protein